MALKLFYNPISPPCRAIQMLLNVLKVKNVQLHEVDILTKKGQQMLENITPLLRVPVLQDNEFTLWESHAIAPYLASKFGINKQLYPENIQTRAIIDQRLHFDTGILFPTLHSTIIPILFHNKCGITHSDVNCIKTCYSYMNEFLKDKHYICGNNLTIADLACLATVSTLDLIYPVQCKKYGNLERYLRNSEREDFYEPNVIGLDRLAHEILEKIILYKSKSMY